MKKVLTLTMLVALAPAALMACGDDDGSGTRDDATGSASGASGSGSGSGSASGSATASDVACVPVGDPDSADSTLEVSLDEWTVKPAETEVAAGAVNFATENIGEEPHELVVVKGEDLPTAEDGSADEEQLPDGALLGEIEKYPAGETCDGVFELEAGTYTLFCNVVEEEEDGTIEAHVEKGMVTTITVT